MTAYQRGVLCGGLLAVALMCVFPPWQVHYSSLTVGTLQFGENTKTLGYAPVWTPPLPLPWPAPASLGEDYQDIARSREGSVVVSASQLLVQIAAVGLLTIVVYIVVSRLTPPDLNITTAPATDRGGQDSVRQPSQGSRSQDFHRE